MRSSGRRDMLPEKVLLEHQLLDLVVDGPAPFAGLFRSLVLYCGYPREVEVSRIMDALIRTERNGWVRAWQLSGSGGHHEALEDDVARGLVAYRAWIPTVADLDDLSVDEVGLWYELTDAGREEWTRYYRKELSRQDRAWMVDDIHGEMLVIVHASSTEMAEEALGYWLSVNPDIRLIESSRSAESVSGFRLRSGLFVTGGTRVTCHYQRSDAIPGA